MDNSNGNTKITKATCEAFWERKPSLWCISALVCRNKTAADSVHRVLWSFVTLSSLSLLYCDFSAFILKFAVIIFTLVKTINHITPKPKQFCPLFTLFPLLVWLEHAYSSYSEIFSNLKCSEICFDALCIFWLGASLVWNESGFASKLLGYFSCAHSLGKLCTCDIQKATYLLDFFYAPVWLFYFLSVNHNAILMMATGRVLLFLNSFLGMWVSVFQFLVCAISKRIKNSSLFVNC